MKFSSERTQPSVDLTARIAIPDPGRIIDLGCGPGNSTAVLRQRWPKADITGLDSSSDMIAAASGSYPHHEWLIGDIAAWSAEIPFDVVFSNAALQWVPNHDVLFPHLFAQVASGGALAVQMPCALQLSPASGDSRNSRRSVLASPHGAGAERADQRTPILLL